MKKFLTSLFRRSPRPENSSVSLGSIFELANEPEDEDFKFKLIPDDHHLTDVGKTAQGNGFWIARHLMVECRDTRDFVAAYVFDKLGNLISADVIDQGWRTQSDYLRHQDIITRLKRKIDATEEADIWVKPFSIEFYGHDFGLAVREAEDGSFVVDAIPGHTLMFREPWDSAGYDT